MATHKQALKRHRQSLRLRERNTHYKSMMKTLIKHVLEAVSEGDVERANKALRQASSVIGRVAQKGIIHSKTASRQISRLSKKVQQLGAAKGQ